MNPRWIALIAAVVVLVVAGVWIARDREEIAAPTSRNETEAVVQDNSGRRVLYWYDPMVPQQRFEKPGKSPFMDMQLKPKYADEVKEAGVQVSPSV